MEEVRRNGSVAARYKYLADGTKLEVSDAMGCGFLYFGSLIYSKRGTIYTPESVGFTGGRIVCTSAGSEVLYHVTDYLGSVRVVADQNGRALEKINYYPFGKRWDAADLPISGNRYLFNGKEWQATGAVNLLDYGARMYDPNLGRWLVQDPLYQLHNPYSFCGGDPINRIDYSGMDYYYNSSGTFLGQDDSGTNYIRILNDGVDWDSLCNKWGFAYSNKAHYVSSFFTSVKLDDFATLAIYKHIAKILGLSSGNFSLGAFGEGLHKLMGTYTTKSYDFENNLLSVEYIDRVINHSKFSTLVTAHISDHIYNIASLFEHEDIHERGWVNDPINYEQKTKIDREIEAYYGQINGKFFPMAQPRFQIQIIKMYFRFSSV